MREGKLTKELRTRAKRFAALVIRHFLRLSKNRDECQVCGKQMLCSGTSVVAHVREASRARSDAEFVSKLGGALQEADETQIWLELLRVECGIDPALCLPIEQEAEFLATRTAMICRTGSDR